MMEGNALGRRVGPDRPCRSRFTRSTTSGRDSRACRWKCCTTPRATALRHHGEAGLQNVYDSSDPRHPKFLQAISCRPTAPHHSCFSPDEHYPFVQNSLLNLEGMSDGSVTVIDLQGGNGGRQYRHAEIARVQSNCIMLLPNHFRGSRYGRMCGSDRRRATGAL